MTTTPTTAKAASRKTETKPKASSFDVEKLRAVIESSLDDDKAEDIIAIPLAGKSDFADYMIIASGRSQRHVSALADKIADRLSEEGFGHVNIEGKDSSDWVLVDAGDIIVHLFRPEVRQLYNLEKMWGVPSPASVRLATS